MAETMSETAGRLLEGVWRLAADITPRAAEIEAGRRIPPDLVEALRSIGVFRMFVPRSHGGLELDVPQAIDIIRALARIDGSVGWNAFIGASGAFILATLPRATYDQLYRDSPDVILSGSVQPLGTAAAAGDGWRVSGRWPFASGCQHADWIGAACVMTQDGKPLPGPTEGAPLVRFFILPARHWQILDTWHAAGLKGTGSHHIAITDMPVPADQLMNFPMGTACVPGPLYAAGAQFPPLLLAAVNIGIAEGALDDLVKVAATRRWKPGAAPMKDSDMYRGELGRIEADIRAARAYLEVQAASHWDHALHGTLANSALTIQCLQTATWIAATCVGAVNACFALGGASALYEDAPLQRRLRDSHAAAQHFALQKRIYVDAGALLQEQKHADSSVPRPVSPAGAGED